MCCYEELQKEGARMSCLKLWQGENLFLSCPLLYREAAPLPMCLLIMSFSSQSMGEPAWLSCYVRLSILVEIIQASCVISQVMQSGWLVVFLFPIHSLGVYLKPQAEHLLPSSHTLVQKHYLENSPHMSSSAVLHICSTNPISLHICP